MARKWLCGIAAAMIVAVAQLPGQVAGANTAAPGPAPQTPKATLQAALACSSDLATATKTPVLLTPGTAETSAEIYSWGYEKVLREAGHPVCNLKTLPNGGLQDMQITVEYVVNAIRHMNTTSGRKVSVIGHSQGGLLNAWALRFWPDLPGAVDDMVAIASPFTGSQLVNSLICPFGICPTAGWQFKVGSAWSGAVTRHPVAAGPSFTSIGSSTDELVWPAPAATRFPGATNVLVQNVCPGRIIGHLGLVADATGHAIVMDALNNPGPANLSRVGTSSCSKLFFDGADSAWMAQVLPTVQSVITTLLKAQYVLSEPPLRDYALAVSDN